MKKTIRKIITLGIFFLLLGNTSLAHACGSFLVKNFESNNQKSQVFNLQNDDVLKASCSCTENNLLVQSVALDAFSTQPQVHKKNAQLNPAGKIIAMSSDSLRQKEIDRHVHQKYLYEKDKRGLGEYEWPVTLARSHL